MNIVFTGGGTAGHVTPNIPLIHALQENGWQVRYFGSEAGIEKGIMDGLNIPFFPISCGKLRRYVSLKNLLEPFRVVKGVIQSFILLRKIKPNVVFSKGGFVAFPVVVGAYLNRIPVIAHESDLSPGLANRLSFPFVDKICLTFEAGRDYFKHHDKISVTGTPIRQQLFAGVPERGLALCGFNPEKPCLLVIGGSLGAGSINECIRKALPVLLEKFQIIHLCGAGKIDDSLKELVGYRQFEYVHDELGDLFAAATIVISRAGANSLYEILALSKPHILIPLSARISRGDQIQNAQHFKKLGISYVIEDEQFNPDALLSMVDDVLAHEEDIKKKIKSLKIESAADAIVAIIKKSSSI